MKVYGGIDLHSNNVEEAIVRDDHNATAAMERVLGGERFVRDVLEKLQVRAKGRKVREGDDRYELREREAAYNAHFPRENGLLRIENEFY